MYIRLQISNVQVMGLKIWGAGWHPRRGDSMSGNNYSDIPEEVDVLVTHEAAFGIFDLTSGRPVRRKDQPWIVGKCGSQKAS